MGIIIRLKKGFMSGSKKTKRKQTPTTFAHLPVEIIAVIVHFVLYSEGTPVFHVKVDDTTSFYGRSPPPLLDKWRNEDDNLEGNNLWVQAPLNRAPKQPGYTSFDRFRLHGSSLQRERWHQWGQLRLVSRQLNEVCLAMKVTRYSADLGSKSAQEFGPPTKTRHLELFVRPPARQVTGVWLAFLEALDAPSRDKAEAVKGWIRSLSMMRGMGFYGEAILKALPSRTHLRELSFSPGFLHDTDIAEIASFHNLQVLWIDIASARAAIYLQGPVNVHGLSRMHGAVYIQGVWLIKYLLSGLHGMEKLETLGVQGIGPPTRRVRKLHGEEATERDNKELLRRAIEQEAGIVPASLPALTRLTLVSGETSGRACPLEELEEPEDGGTGGLLADSAEATWCRILSHLSPGLKYLSTNFWPRVHLFKGKPATTLAFPHLRCLEISDSRTPILTERSEKARRAVSYPHFPEMFPALRHLHLDIDFARWWEPDVEGRLCGFAYTGKLRELTISGTFGERGDCRRLEAMLQWNYCQASGIKVDLFAVRKQFNDGGGDPADARPTPRTLLRHQVGEAIMPVVETEPTPILSRMFRRMALRGRRQGTLQL